MVIEAAKELYSRGLIDTVVVVCPAAVRISWADPEFGEIQKWQDDADVMVWRKEKPVLCWPSLRPALSWRIISYEFARDHYRWLIEALGGRNVLMVADESIRIKNPTAKTTKNLIKLSDQAADRRVILNGTPGTMLDCYGQYRFLGESAVEPYVSFYGQWRPHFSVWMQKPFPKLIRYINKEDFDRLTLPITLRRGKSPSLPPQRFSTVAVPLSNGTWKHYCAMKKDMITWLEKQPSVAVNVGVQIMRLSQITSGFLGGVASEEAKEISSEKRDWARKWFEERCEEDPEFRAIFWCQFRAELLRLQKEIPVAVKIIGGQSEGERRAAIEGFTTGDGKALVGQPHAGGYGLNLVRAHNVVYLSRDYSQINREQSEDRTHRIGQEFPVDYIDVLAEGPNGERTIDHVVLKALKAKQDLYKWTAKAWLDNLAKI